MNLAYIESRLQYGFWHLDIGMFTSTEQIVGAGSAVRSGATLPETVGALDRLVDHLRDYGGLQDLPAAHDGAKVVACLDAELLKYQTVTVDFASRSAPMMLLPLSWYRGFFEWARTQAHVVELDIGGTDYPKYRGMTLFPVTGLRLPRMVCGI